MAQAQGWSSCCAWSVPDQATCGREQALHKGKKLYRHRHGFAFHTVGHSSLGMVPSGTAPDLIHTVGYTPRFSHGTVGLCPGFNPYHQV